jgi:hypothetical protein
VAARGREYALAVAAGAAGSTRPIPVNHAGEMTPIKRSFVSWGRLPWMSMQIGDANFPISVVRAVSHRCLPWS